MVPTEPLSTADTPGVAWPEAGRLTEKLSAISPRDVL